MPTEKKIETTKVTVTPQKEAKFLTLAQTLSVEADADVLLYNGEIRRNWDDTVIEMCSSRNRRKNVILYLVTDGGDPHAAYRIASCLQKKYHRFVVMIPGFCKSAGTIITMGAHEIAMTDCGELGPVDVQLAKQDELWQYSSGLNINAALEQLRDESLTTLEHYFVSLTSRSGGRITTKTAMQIAKDLVIGLYGRIFEQIDPTYLGEVNRAMKIAMKYGEVLNKGSKNLKDEALVQMTTGYPDHGFVLDREQIKELFENVREASAVEAELATELGQLAKWPLPITKTGQKPVMVFLSSEAQTVPSEEQNEEPRSSDSREGVGDAKSTVSESGKPKTHAARANELETIASA